MAKLISEFRVTGEQVQTIIEESINGSPKKYYIGGSFLRMDDRNQNGRLYPERVVRPCIDEFVTNKVRMNRAVGELNHPHKPEIDLGRISHIIEDLHYEGKDVIGKARLLDTDQGKIAKVLIDEGLSFGVSLRALGDSDSQGVMQPGLTLLAIDLVADPSFATSFVDPILEAREYIIDGDKIITVNFDSYEKIVTKKNVSPQEVAAAFNKLIYSLKNR